MNLIKIIIITLISSSDCLIVGLNYGAKHVKINLASNLVVSFISGISTFLIMFLGKKITGYIPYNYTKILSGSLLIILGFFFLINFLKNNMIFKITFANYNNALKKPEVIDLNNNFNIEFKEALMLGFVLCINNIGLGLSASFMGLNIYITSVLSLLFCSAFIVLGNYLGKLFSKEKFSIYAELFSSIIMILIGAIETLS